MQRETIIRSALAIVWFLTIVAHAWSQGSTSVRYEQTFMDGSTPIALGANSPDPFAQINDAALDTSTFTVESTYALDALKLGTTAFISVSGRVGDTSSNWKTIEATATSTSELQESVTVQGVGMDNGQMGTVEFNWALHGNTEFILQDLDNTNVTDFTSITYLQANVPGAGGVPFTENRSLPAGAKSASQNFPVVGEIFSYTVPFMAGTELFVDFTLFSQVSVAAEVIDTSTTGPGGGRIFAQLNAAYGNTAVLDSVIVRDGSGRLQPDMIVMGPNGAYPTAVPEPGSFLMLGLLGCVACGGAIVQSRNRLQRGGKLACARRSSMD